MRIWSIDPARTAMENLFSAVSFAAKGFRYKYSKAGVVLTGEEWNPRTGYVDGFPLSPVAPGIS